MSGVYIEDAQPLTAEGIRKVCNLEKGETLSDKRICAQLFDNSFGYGEQDLKKTLKEFEEEIDKSKSSDKSGEWIVMKKTRLKRIIKKHFGGKLIK